MPERDEKDLIDELESIMADLDPETEGHFNNDGLPNINHLNSVVDGYTVTKRLRDAAWAQLQEVPNMTDDEEPDPDAEAAPSPPDADTPSAHDDVSPLDGEDAPATDVPTPPDEAEEIPLQAVVATRPPQYLIDECHPDVQGYIEVLEAKVHVEPEQVSVEGFHRRDFEKLSTRRTVDGVPHDVYRDKRNGVKYISGITIPEMPRYPFDRDV